jgi:hypothetical protein
MEGRCQGNSVPWYVAIQAGRHRLMDKRDCLDTVFDQIERPKGRGHAMVEQSTRILDQLYGYTATRYFV